jgi:hypothetical protein
MAYFNGIGVKRNSFLPVRMPRTFPVFFGAGHYQFAFINSLQAAQLRSDFLQSIGWAAEHDDFQAESVRQVGVHRRYHQIGIVVLQLRQMIAKLRAVMVVHQRQRSRRVLAIRLPSLGSKPLANELPQCFTARGELSHVAVLVELRQQIFFQRNGKANDVRHDEGGVVVF